ncbi:MAG: hypothetical protein EXS22_07785 [Pedosphaera sp.]|nr:hypothetical protein [Pedosphaera sp.]MSU43923.1 hypothetical protein [Pedosphaera sp.]
MSDDHSSPEYFEKKFKPMIWLVGTVLIVGTAISFAADLFKVSEKLGAFRWAIVIGLTVASIKASAVVAVFMHLYWDAKWKTISLTLISTIFFFIGLMYLTNASEIFDKPGNEIKGNQHAFDPVTGMPMVEDAK